MQPGAFCGLKSLNELDLSKNKLTNAPELLPVKTTLRVLKLGKNEIHHFSSDYFHGFEVLEMVSIENNGLYSAPNIGNIGHSLEVFILNDNKLKTLDNKLMGGLTMSALEYLWARNNEIEYLEVAILALMPRLTFLNPLRAKFFRGNINIYLHFVSFLHFDTTQVVEILPQIRQEPTYST